MNKIIFSVFLIFQFFMCSVCFSQEYDVRNVTWGMTKEEVKKTENISYDSILDLENHLIFEVEEPLFGLKYKMIYVFHQDRLKSLLYEIYPDTKNKANIIVELIKENLSNKYISKLEINNNMSDIEKTIAYRLRESVAMYESENTNILLQYPDKSLKIILVYQDKNSVQ